MRAPTDLSTDSRGTARGPAGFPDTPMETRRRMGGFWLWILLLFLLIAMFARPTRPTPATAGPTAASGDTAARSRPRLWCS